ncbi:Spg5p KNAG_0F01630 [Huiozyma naganishii CBS 8797]|uniref:Uncharacterized protein n=1 Tax=Huiozyma naganishii (strain ATCC MYA-139 / BCRC 22969 / CBS 8797 / KCTC 17520 / NBRC 10181 / NCYC 3082 / Yp74L-3) TaxID=1071383 RepID=J7S8B7_HUIN7|nr:hypothetical protein KNAG_0F01630 [Kazachstania naganishii CBS 8797]CCK70831.1 hypothetical protein KNAG_0F01630 [Kazachstania naganishii CBS 8797]
MFRQTVLAAKNRLQVLTRVMNLRASRLIGARIFNNGKRILVPQITSTARNLSTRYSLTDGFAVRPLLYSLVSYRSGYRDAKHNPRRSLWYASPYKVPKQLLHPWNLALDPSSHHLDLSSCIRCTVASSQVRATAIKSLLRSVKDMIDIERNKINVFNLMKRDSTVGAYVEFLIPSIEQQQFDFLNEATLIAWKTKIQSLDALQANIAKILHNYGSLPITKSMSGNKLRVHFPNRDPQETELLMSDLGIVEGIVYPDNSETFPLSRSPSVSSLEESLCIVDRRPEFSPVLSD